MPSRTIETGQVLDRAISLLVMPTLDNLRAVEEALRQAIGNLPEGTFNNDNDGATRRELARKVRLCERLLQGAEALRPGTHGTGSAYNAQGARAFAAAPRLLAEA